MTIREVMDRLQALGDQKTRELNVRRGAGENQYGVKLGDLRALAKEIKSNHELGLELWETGNLEARLLATLIMKPKQLTADDLDRMARESDVEQAIDWFGSYIVKAHPEKEALRERWMTSGHPTTLRLGWSLTTERVVKDAVGLDLSGLLDRIEAEMPTAHPLAQWTMNFCLGEIGIHHPTHRERAVALGEKLGMYRDWPTSKGCIPPYVPVWVSEMVRRQG